MDRVARRDAEQRLNKLAAAGASGAERFSHGQQHGRHHVRTPVHAVRKSYMAEQGGPGRGPAPPRARLPGHIQRRHVHTRVLGMEGLCYVTC